MVSHFKLVSGEKKMSEDLVAQMTYVIELLHKNQAPKNIITKARVKFTIDVIPCSCLSMVSFQEIMSMLISS